MTSTQLRPDAARYPLVLPVTPRYSDLDPSRRVGREALIRWFEDARIQVMRQIFPQVAPVGGILVVAVRVDVLAPLRIADDYRIGFGITRVGTSSFTDEYGVFLGDELVALGSATCVVAKDGAALPIPADVRASLEELRLPGPASTGRVEVPGSRLVRENYPFRYDVRTRFGDIDTNRHVNNVVLAGWYLDGLAELHTDVLGYPTGGPMDGLAPSSLRVDFRDEVHYPGIYQLRVGVVELGDHEATYACGLFDGPRCIGLADATGAFRFSGEDGEIDLGAAFEPFRMRG